MSPIAHRSAIATHGCRCDCRAGATNHTTLAAQTLLAHERREAAVLQRDEIVPAAFLRKLSLRKRKQLIINARAATVTVIVREGEQNLKERERERERERRQSLGMSPTSVVLVCVRARAAHEQAGVGRERGGTERRQAEAKGLANTTTMYLGVEEEDHVGSANC